jgi:hypothetical protein
VQNVEGERAKEHQQRQRKTVTIAHIYIYIVSFFLLSRPPGQSISRGRC